MGAVEMPDRIAEHVVMCIRQNRGTLSKNRRDSEFKPLRDDEVLLIEGIVGDAFAGFDDSGRPAAEDLDRSSIADQAERVAGPGPGAG
jgi:hypothetical protein